jgi:hypothetical protein
MNEDDYIYLMYISCILAGSSATFAGFALRKKNHQLLVVFHLDFSEMYM